MHQITVHFTTHGDALTFYVDRDNQPELDLMHWITIRHSRGTFMAPMDVIKFVEINP